ncbi:MAG: hypothetical protein HN576_04165 [Bacteriovoracaceae bacterium]|jgi:hypothetical protein|nr:hypothetical protein [Bacteriovoracaceae bacterium]
MKRRIEVLFISLLIVGPAHAGQKSSSWFSSQVKSFFNTVDDLNTSPKNPCPEGPSSSTELDNPTNQKRVWELNGFYNPYFKNIDLYSASDNTQYTHSVQVDLIMIRGSGWDEETIIERYRKAAEIYKQCGIKLTPARFISVTPPSGIVDIERSPRNVNQENSVIKFASAVPKSKGMSTMFVRSFTNGSTGTSGPEFAYGESSPLYNKTWLTTDVIDDNYTGIRENYSPEAHELSHNLLNIGHMDGEPNLLHGDYNSLNDVLTDEQCEIMKMHETAKEMP